MAVVIKCILCILYTMLVSSKLVTGYNLQELDDDISKIFACQSNPGMSVSIVKDGETIFAKGYGVKEITTQTRVSNTTLFGIASLSKAFAATLIVKLLEKTSYTIKTPLKDILGNALQFADMLRTKYATLEDLLSHRMGISSNNYLRFDSNLTRENLLRRVSHLEASKTFRGSFIYSNLMYGVLTTIAEKLGDKPWEQLIKDEIYKPVGMPSSSFATILDFENADFAVPYIKKYNSTIYNPVPLDFSRRWALLCGSGCVMSNAVDMANWMIFHLNDGKTRGGEQLIDKDTVKNLRKSRNVATPLKYFKTPTFPKATSRDGYGLGWFVGYYDGMRIQWHTGSTFGYKAIVTLYPDYNIGIFTAITGSDFHYKYRISLHNYITDKILGRSPWLSTSAICLFPSPWVNDTFTHTKFDYISPSLNLTSYTGVYINVPYGNLEIYINASTNQLEAIYGFGRFSLKRYYSKSKTTDTFYGHGEGINVQMDVNPVIVDLTLKDGIVQSIIVPGFDSSKPPTFNRYKSGTSSPSTSRQLMPWSVVTTIYFTVLSIHASY